MSGSSIISPPISQTSMSPLWCVTVLALAMLSVALEPDWYKRNKETIQKIYDLTVFPKNAVIISEGASAVPEGLFNANTTGRITPVGEFFGFQDSIEYFFGLAPLPRGFPPNGAITNATLVQFTSGCAEVAASTVYLTVSTINRDNSTGPYITTLKQTAFWRFDNTGAVLKYEAWIPSLDRFVGPLNGVLDFYTPANMNNTILGVCAQQAQTCVGNNTVYNSVPDCVQALAAKPFGRYDEAWGDNVVCRTIHVLLTKFRPEVHCPHVGPTGGGKCIDVEYNDAFFNDKFLFGGSGEPFNCNL
ncbi:hypothetical protein B0H16DRAFT_1693108 [Mycena metata]|uniref:Uncharacterized protein n=1 Tax=Mycena metata TaxID=1033252 RepID=A0AAD7N567_9AGAR|nr:hypothetical protein B0H16DRAFT_1693108 [Mycena metata]